MFGKKSTVNSILDSTMYNPRHGLNQSENRSWFLIGAASAGWLALLGLIYSVLYMEIWIKNSKWSKWLWNRIWIFKVNYTFPIIFSDRFEYSSVMPLQFVAQEITSDVMKEIKYKINTYKWLESLFFEFRSLKCN